MSGGQLIAEATITSSGTSTITFNSIPQTYEDLMIIGSIGTDTTVFSTGIGTWYVKPNNTSTGGQVAGRSSIQQSPTTTNYGLTEAAFWYIEESIATARDSDHSMSPFYMYMPRYASTAVKLQALVAGGAVLGVPGGSSSSLYANSRENFASFLFDQTAALTRLDLYPSHGAFKAGSKLSLYGI